MKLLSGLILLLSLTACVSESGTQGGDLRSCRIQGYEKYRKENPGAALFGLVGAIASKEDEQVARNTNDCMRAKGYAVENSPSGV